MKWHYTATAKAIMFLIFDIDVFIFTYLDLNPLGPCIAEKQQSDKKLLKVKTSRA